jgi:hypothetical protein
LLSLSLEGASRGGCAGSQSGEASSKRQGDGQRFQKKKAMNPTHFRIEASAPANVRPSSVSKTSNSGQLQRLDFQKRETNRRLPTSEVLNLLEREAPLLFRLAQIVGNWVWIQFPEKQPREITSMLAQIGFHWNKNRQVWQHPCGVFCDQAADYDPRKRYGCHAAAA